MTDPLALIVVFALAAISVVLGWWCVTISRRIDEVEERTELYTAGLLELMDILAITADELTATDRKDHPDD